MVYTIGPMVYGILWAGLDLMDYVGSILGSGLRVPIKGDTGP